MLTASVAAKQQGWNIYDGGVKAEKSGAPSSLETNNGANYQVATPIIYRTQINFKLIQ